MRRCRWPDRRLAAAVGVFGSLVLLAAPIAGAGAELAAAAGALHHPVRARRRRRHRRAADPGAAAEELGPAGRDREPPRRRQHHRHPGGAVRQRRPHLPVGTERQLHRASVPVQEAALRSRRHRAGRALLLDHPRRRRAGVDEDQDRGRVREARARQPTASSTPPRCRASPSSRSTTSCTTTRSRRRRSPTRTSCRPRTISPKVACRSIRPPTRSCGRTAKAAASPCWRSSARSARRACKNIPTGIEAGFPELEMDGNVGLFASPAVPAALVERIGNDIVAVSNDKAIEDRLNQTAQTPARGGAKEFAASIAAAARVHRQDRQDARPSADAVMRIQRAHPDASLACRGEFRSRPRTP